MPPKRTKKAPKIQTKLDFPRQLKPQTSSSPLVQVLSQYELMLMVTNHLSSADIIHLTATCHEIKTYLTDDKTIYSNIRSNALCDGKGIEARAKCFGHWKGDATKAQGRCRGKDCLPCDNCDAMVCNNCRFHIKYLDDVPCCQDDPSHWKHHEVDFAQEFDNILRCHATGCTECPGLHSGNYPIEAIRAANLAGEPRERRWCSNCKPHLINEDDGQVWIEAILDILDSRDEDDGWCECDLSTHFVYDSWLCIPCFFESETKAHSRRSKREVSHSEKTKAGKGGVKPTCKHDKVEYFCDCGKVADIPYLVGCRWCDEYIKTEYVDAFML